VPEPGICASDFTFTRNFTLSLGLRLRPLHSFPAPKYRIFKNEIHGLPYLLRPSLWGK
jgi:hypothetical protein